MHQLSEDIEIAFKVFRLQAKYSYIKRKNFAQLLPSQERLPRSVCANPKVGASARIPASLSRISNWCPHTSSSLTSSPAVNESPNKAMRRVSGGGSREKSRFERMPALFIVKVPACRIELVGGGGGGGGGGGESSRACRLK